MVMQFLDLLIVVHMSREGKATGSVGVEEENDLAKEVGEDALTFLQCEKKLHALGEASAEGEERSNICVSCLCAIFHLLELWDPLDCSESLGSKVLAYFCRPFQREGFGELGLRDVTTVV